MTAHRYAAFHRWLHGAAVLSMFVLAIVVMAGCRGSRPRPADFSPLQNPDPLLRAGTPAELLALLERRAPDHRTVQAQGRVTVEVEGHGGRQWFDANLLYRDPDSVRLRGSRVGPGTLFEVLATPAESWFYLRQERDLYVGTSDDLREHLGLLGSLDLKELMSSILIAQELRFVLTNQAQSGWRVRRDDIEFRDQRGGLQRIWTIDRHSGLVRRVELREDGRTMAFVEYDRYVLLEGPELLPDDLRVILPREGVTARLRISTYNLDPQLREDVVFESRPSGARATYPLWQLRWDGPEDAPEPES
jgi:hypothetical protein